MTSRGYLPRRNRADDSSALLHGWVFDLAVYFQLFHHFLHHTMSLFDVGDFATTEHDRNLDFVALIQEVNRLLDLKVDVVLTSLGP